MLDWLNKRRGNERIARALYGSSVAAARRPGFFLAYGVPDTVSGRFELLVLHLFLVLDRLRRDGADRQPIAREISEQMFEALDDAMREMGVGDLTVPKRMHKLAGAFYGRLDAYAEALDGETPLALEEALKRNLYGESPAAPGEVARLADYVRQTRTALAAAPTDGIVAGDVPFPPIVEAGP